MISIVFFINPINMGPYMAKGWLLLIAVLCFSLPQVSPLIDNASAIVQNYEPGYTEWELENTHRIYITGDGEDVNLTRDYKGASEGDVGINFNQQLNLGPLSLPPLENSFNGTFINGNRTERGVIKAGDSVRLGTLRGKVLAFKQV